jgi:putative ABC transport system permease protein
MMRDILESLRNWRQRPVFHLLLVLVIALGLGPAIAVSGVAKRLLLGGVNLPNADRLVRVTESLPDFGEGLNVAPGVYLALSAAKSPAFESYTAMMTAEVTLVAHEQQPRRVHIARVTPSFFAVTATLPSVGRAFRAEDAVLADGELGVLADTPYLLLSDRLWRSAFAADPMVVGSFLELDDRLYEVVGVMPPGFGFPEQADLWTPLAFGGLAPQDWGGFFLQVVGLLPKDATVEGAATVLETLSQRIRQSGGEFNQGLTLDVQDLRSTLVGDRDASVLLVWLLTAIILLGTAINVGHLLLLRSASRDRSFALRFALGARRGQIYRRLAVDSLAIWLPGALIALAVANLGLVLFDRQLPLGQFGFRPVRLEGEVLALAGGLAVLCALLTSVLPGLYAGRPELLASLGHGGLQASWRRRRSTSRLLGAQVGLSLVLLFSAQLVSRSFFRLQEVDLGFRPEGLWTADCSLPAGPGSDPARGRSFVREAIRALSALPGVQSAAVGLRLPIVDEGGGIWFRVPLRDAGEDHEATFHTVSPGYFEVLGLPFVAGGAFDSSFHEFGEPVVVVTESLANMYFAGQALNRTILLTPWPDQPRRIVGVVRDLKQGGLRSEIAPAIYVPYDQIALPTLRIVVRSKSANLDLGPAIREAIWRIEPRLGFDVVAPFSQRLAGLLEPERWTWMLIVAFGFLGLLLALTGVYSATREVVEQRLRDLAIRAALGAGPSDLVFAVVRAYAGSVAVGLAAGIAGCLVVGRLLQALLYEVSPLSIGWLITSVMVFGCLVAVAMILPARRTARMDAATILR